MSTASSSPQGNRPASAPSSYAPDISPQLRKASQRVAQLQKSIPLSSWSSIDVGHWLEVIGFPQYRKTFISRSIDGHVLLRMTPADYDHVGVRNLGHQKQMIAMVTQLKDQAFNAEEAIKEIPKKKTLGTLVKQKRSMELRSGLLGNFSWLLDDLLKQFVQLTKQFNDLVPHFEDIMEAGEESLAQARMGIVQLKEKVGTCEDLVAGEWDMLNSEARKASGDLSCNRSNTDLWSGLMLELKEPIIPPTPKKAKSEKEIVESVKRFYGAQLTHEKTIRQKTQFEDSERRKMASAAFREGKIIGSTLDIYNQDQRKQKHDDFMARHWHAHLDSLKKKG